VDPGFFYETVAPLLIVGNTSLIAISTLTSEINFYSRLLRMRDKVTNLPLFSVLSVTLACAKCREDGKAADCAHMLHLVPRWQSGDRHIKLKTVMQDRPDLIESELSGLAFDSLQQVFKSVDMDIMFAQTPPAWVTNDVIHVFIDPAAGGPGSDYAVLSIARQKGLITVRAVERIEPPMHPLPQALRAVVVAQPPHLVLHVRPSGLRLGFYLGFYLSFCLISSPNRPTHHFGLHRTGGRSLVAPRPHEAHRRRRRCIHAHPSPRVPAQGHGRNDTGEHHRSPSNPTLYTHHTRPTAEAHATR